ncbi:MAG: hypothetical protein EP329_16860 [Deltaproteobacteria bacterium]|nr:MAG: hypothetical protein EP329_16860 [Deltaproteobacteria bacterium]
MKTPTLLVAAAIAFLVQGVHAPTARAQQCKPPLVVFQGRCVHPSDLPKRPKARPCDAGQERTRLTKGRCCWPNQFWAEGRCRGVPTCQRGWVAAGEGCACAEGKAPTSDVGACCWPGQFWVDEACRGIPTGCPTGWEIAGEGCAALAPCPPGLARRGKQCVACGGDEVIVEGACRPCPANAIPVDGKCAPCPKDHVAVAGRCELSPEAKAAAEKAAADKAAADKAAADKAAEKQAAADKAAQRARAVAWVAIRGGDFEMGSNDGPDNERPRHRVILGGFELGRTEVTVDEYARCVAAGDCTAPETGQRYCNWEREGRGRHPVNCVTWEQASRFCAWAGGRLPTEAEWEFAARSRGKHQRYPWGDEEPNCQRAVMNQTKGVTSQVTEGCGEDRTWEVCSSSRGSTTEGLCDMAGNVWEWVSDWYRQDYYDQSPRTDPRGPGDGSGRVIRGGDLFSLPRDLSTTRRGLQRPTLAHARGGFRCARSGPESAMGGDPERDEAVGACYWHTQGPTQCSGEWCCACGRTESQCVDACRDPKRRDCRLEPGRPCERAAWQRANVAADRRWEDWCQPR